MLNFKCGFVWGFNRTDLQSFSLSEIRKVMIRKLRKMSLFSCKEYYTELILFTLSYRIDCKHIKSRRTSLGLPCKEVIRTHSKR